MANSFLLLEDGVSYLLLEDGTSKLILETMAAPTIIFPAYVWLRLHRTIVWWALTSLGACLNASWVT
jgi:hypothetical protein